MSCYWRAQACNNVSSCDWLIKMSDVWCCGKSEEFSHWHRTAMRRACDTRTPESPLRGMFWQKGSLCGLFFGSPRPILSGLSYRPLPGAIFIRTFEHSSKKNPKNLQKSYYYYLNLSKPFWAFVYIYKVSINHGFNPPHYLIILPSFYRRAIFEPVPSSANFFATRRSVRDHFEQSLKKTSHFVE